MIRVKERVEDIIKFLIDNFPKCSFLFDMNKNI